jgi:hypothetical protein
MAHIWLFPTPWFMISVAVVYNCAKAVVRC